MRHVVWGVRASRMDFRHYDGVTRVAFRVGARLPRLADVIIVNSEAGRAQHATDGYCGERMVVIPNGIDTERFRPDREAGLKVRAEWGVAVYATTSSGRSAASSHLCAADHVDAGGTG